ncbi:class I SAM-dependent DNA methyltransferase [Aliiroseovarius sp. PrR006]|uniref:class I SAM-dependent DNA methyltransferase n=1 Tax=Aliiroseovarius sp. PrR006 TaxID=2706883 RepID=UPI0013D31B46|nr:class I SAM-dependent DNA methyltransferase [Aliiroseovarius sp. PrR006]NDW53655.1 class I SAM-dependent DNA methyltransferase [Aliiroseovarius sp. PrR006]
MTNEKVINEFIERWRPSGGSEMANFQIFASELTTLLGVEAPKPATSDGQNNDYRFERPVTFTHTGRKKRGRIDLYRKGSFILEAKQGAERQKKADEYQLALLTEEEAPKTQIGHGMRGSAKWDDTMLKARNQADGYARAVSKEDGWPPFLMIVDVGHVIELYADFSRQGQGYSQFPDGNRYRIKLDDLREEETRDLLCAIWDDPMSLDPALQSAKVTREIASHLAELGKSFEAQGHASEAVARFLMRCLFTMFAEDVELIPKESFTKTLHELRGHPQHAAPTLEALWQTMNLGGFSTVLKTDLLRFNGGLFKDADALPLDNVQLSLLIEAAEADWRQVEPAIFGTLLERALDKKQRHKLGAHYTPRAYVERLVVPTIMEPLRGDWKDVQAAALTLADQGRMDAAIDTVRAFHDKLCQTRVLDPACGSGNFLYVALEMMKRLEGEVTALLDELGDKQNLLITIDPHQFLGLELNPWAANVAELVLWIGYLQWHFRTYGKAAPSEPVLRDFNNIVHCDAVLEWNERIPRLDEHGNAITRWDGTTTMRHPATGEEVPDPSARVQVYDYTDPEATLWPAAEFIIGNPPFIGGSKQKNDLGSGYVEALRKAYPNIPDSVDFVMYWWAKAADSTKKWNPKTSKGTRRFGLITTNSLRQLRNRAIVEPYLRDPQKTLSLVYSVPDHPWVDALYGAAVRISMTVASAGRKNGTLETITEEIRDRSESLGRRVSYAQETGRIFSNLRIGADVLEAGSLTANKKLSARGAFLIGKGFLLSKPKADQLAEGTDAISARVIRPFLGGYDLTQKHRHRWVIDFWGLSADEARLGYPAAFQHVLDTVKPVRDENDVEWRRENWWVFGDPSRSYRAATRGLNSMIVTSRTAKHRIFQLQSCENLPESEVVVVGDTDYALLAILSSRQHKAFSLATCGWMGVGNDPRYNNSLCFDPFPFPDATNDQTKRLRTLGEKLDTHRKARQAAYPKLTLTKIYNVLDKLHAGEAVEGKDKEIYEQGLVGILKDMHDQIDEAVADAYGWPADLSDDDILFRLVALNKERAEEEAKGHIRWLRPEYQNPEGKRAAKGKNSEMDLEAAPAAKITVPWPKALPDQIAAVREALGEMGEATPTEISRRFKGAGPTRIQPLLESLVALGQADMIEEGRFAA